MTRYSKEPDNPTKSCKSRGPHLRVHFKNNHKTALQRWSNTDFKDLDVDRLVVDHIQVKRAQCLRRRTHRAHSRIYPYMSSPYHVELF
uniref:Large ribosomal subunit protein uL22 n=1 Tax=Megaselia scalaris TaxID=36166 RepID=T1GVV9_MEGSC